MKYRDLEIKIRQPTFTRQDLLLQGLTIYDYQLTLWVKKGYLIRLKRGVYAFAKDVAQLRGEEIAHILYQPSYISMESALALYGFIPEMVYAFVSVTSKINRTFDNYFGRFIYRHIKSGLFWGYEPVETRHGIYLIAEPEKAVLDYLYLNLAVINRQADLESMRFNRDQLKQKLNEQKFRKYLDAFKIKKLEKWALKCLP